MQQIIFSIIVPCFQAEAYLEECVDSLLKQTIGICSLEIILVDDASFDGTKAFMERLQKSYPETIKTVYLKENKRQGGARNAGLKIAKGRYISFIDADDWVDVSMYEILYREIQTYAPQIIQFSHKNVRDGMEEYVSGCVIPGFVQIEDEAMRKLFLMAGVLTCGSQMKVYEKAFLDKVQVTFPEQVIYEEPYFVYPQLLYVETFVSLSDALYYCRIHESSTMQTTKRQNENLQYHPKVQKLLFEQLQTRSDVFMRYYDEIEYYFLLTYYIETLYFAGNEQKELSFEFFCTMQQTIKELCPDWKKNPYLKQEENQMIVTLLKTCEKSIDKDQLLQLCDEVVQTLNQEKSLG